MKNISLLLCSCFFLFISIRSNAQEGSTDYFNNFQRTSANNPDSAMYFLRKLAVADRSTMEDLLHNSFAQNFRPAMLETYAKDTAFLNTLKEHNMTLDSVRKMIAAQQIASKQILAIMTVDDNSSIRQNGYSIEQWVEAQNNSNDIKKLEKIGSEYLEYLKKSDNLFAERKVRYGLMIYNIMTKHLQLKPISYKLFNFIFNNLKEHQTASVDVETFRNEKEIRAWYRYLYAYTNFIASQNNLNNKISFLKNAAIYSPDAADKTVSHAYFYEMFFLFGKEKPSFENDYLAVLENDDEKFNMLMELSFKEPFFKAKAKPLYKGSISFNEYWLTEFNKKHKSAPTFSLTKTDGIEYTLTNTEDQWTLIDFWGTWCGPCRREHPDLEKFYQQTKDGKATKVNVFTIASNDRESAVKEYMKKFSFNFPVAMSDNEVEKKYNVSSWPSKFLVSPQGRYVIIPFGVNWQQYIEQYIN